MKPYHQLALEAAIVELTLWVEQRGSGEVGGNVRGALQTISKNEEFINVTFAVLMPPERSTYNVTLQRRTAIPL